ncbi:prolyl 4-hydroxylase [Pararobbsia silviterrae]|uniref:Prolyl 4-hydroxylase n=1 Tax=Pararobbsia silviterrae TaxID=1792498 RepID=A0A494Y5K1_9BURK|nr:prolyl 4-hydroxylase [Pararobbsia silviterrae]
MARIARLDWADIASQLDAEGYAVLPGLLDAIAARELACRIDAVCPAPLDDWGTTFYRHLAAVANRWQALLGIDGRYPPEWDAFLACNRRAGQMRPLSHAYRLSAGEHVALHQCNEGEHVFPLQIVAVLSEPGVDFTGGEFVMTEQRPRMQSRPIVVPMRLGDAAVIATAQRPCKGANGYYRVNLKHAISRVHAGRRVGIEWTFHNGYARA